MQYLDITLGTPFDDLRLDEALLAECDSTGREALRVWEPRTPSVVAGRSNRSLDDVDLAACERLGIPVFRRHSGGGTVVVGPGCLNYAVTLDAGRREVPSGIRETNRYVMRRLRRALAGVTGQAVAVRGFTDLVIGDRKFSGNAQHRRRRGVLFHGTILCDMDIGLIGRLLRMPARAPDYRGARGHEEFLTNISVPPGEVREALRCEWRAVPAEGSRVRALEVRFGPGAPVFADPFPW